MFLSYCHSVEPPYGQTQAGIHITDTDFFHYSPIDPDLDVNHGMAECIGYHIIQCYEERNLPVAKNLLKALIFHGKRYDFNLDFCIWMNKDRNPLYPKYAPEIEKLLLLI